MHARARTQIDTHPRRRRANGGERAYVRVKSGPPIDSEQPRAGPDRPDPATPRVPLLPRRRPPFRGVVPFSICVLYVFAG